MSSESIDAIQLAQAHLDSIKGAQIQKDIETQTSMFARWTKEQETELAAQIKNVLIEIKKKNILEQLDELEKQEERLTYFDRRDEIERAYDGKGFPEENPADIPIEPDESKFAQRAERHFKPWPKYMNRPKPDPAVVRSKEENLESLRRIYLHETSKSQPDGATSAQAAAASTNKS